MYEFVPKFKKYSQLIIKSDGNDWVQNQQSKEMIPVCEKLKISTLDRKYSHLIKNQCIFHFSKYFDFMDRKLL